MKKKFVCVFLGGIIGLVLSLPGPIDIGLTWWTVPIGGLIGSLMGYFLSKDNGGPGFFPL